MANCHSQMTGVLVLSQVTPVIRGLFKAFDLDESPGEGRAYIASADGISWSSVMDGLEAVADEIGLPGADDVIQRWADHFGVSVRIAVLTQGIDGDEDADLATLFELAKAFDDGHGLAWISAEQAMFCDAPRHNSCGGIGDFIGTHVSMQADSADAHRVGKPLQEALADGDIEKAAEVVGREVLLLLQRINDPDQREQVKSALRRLDAGVVLAE